MALRGVEPEQAADHLDPTLRRTLPDPSVLACMDVASAHLADAVREGRAVGVFGDYDVDGACAAAIVAATLRELGCVVHTHIPDRIAEGYGPNRAALERLIDAGCRTLVCVDCGTAAGDVLDPLAARAGIVVLDHHLGAHVPAAIVSTVNPNQPGDRSGLGVLCAAGIAFLAMIALVRRLRADGFFEARPAPALFDLLDLVALATVCDMVPLVGVNRTLVAQGLRVMARRGRAGLAALLDSASVSGPPNARTCGYALGPRINAGGRIGDASLGLALLLETDPARASERALRLDAVNRERRDVEASILAGAMAMAEAQVVRGHPVVLIEGEDWHPGVVGIIASRIMRAFNRPACVGARRDGVVKGSGRSVPGLDLGAAVIAAREAGLLRTGGGHAMAAGYGHDPGGREALHAFLDRRLAGAAGRARREPIALDAAVAVGAADLALANAIARLAPFGAGNDEPCLLLRRARVARADRLGAERRTLRAMLVDEVGTSRLKSIRFGDAGDAVAGLLERSDGRLLDLAGHLRAEQWNGEAQVCFAIEDAAFANEW